MKTTLGERGATAKGDLKYSHQSCDDEVPDVAQLMMILDAIPSHQPASHLYRALSAVCGFAGLRPGEAVVLEVDDLRILILFGSHHPVGENFDKQRRNWCEHLSQTVYIFEVRGCG